VELADLALLDHLGDLGRAAHDLQRRHQALAVLPLDQLHRDDALQDLSELGPHLPLLVRREGVKDTVDRLRSVVGVQGREDEVAGLRRGDHGRHGLGIAHLADHDDVRILPHGVAQRLGEGAGVGPHLALGDRGLVVAEQELHRIFDGDHVHRAVLGDVPDHRRQRGRLAAAGRAGDQDEPHGQGAEVEQHLRQVQVLEALDLVGDATEAGGDVAALHIDVAAEAGEAAHAVAEVDGHLLFELRLLPRVEDPQEHLVELVHGQRLRFQREQTPADPQQGWTGRLQMKIRSPLVGHQLQETVEFHDGSCRIA
jgi:hypothetical protein